MIAEPLPAGARRFFVGLGGNVGDRRDHLRRAAAALAGLAGVELCAASSLWETRPIGPGSGRFLNAAVELRSPAAGPRPAELLAAMLAIEREHGRVRRERWGDRTLDLDLLCGFAVTGELELGEPGLRLPHPQLPRRDFVLCPLLELDPELRVGGRPCAELLAALAPGERSVLRRLPEPLVECASLARESRGRAGG